MAGRKRPFKRARAFIQGLHPTNWSDFAKSKRRPKDIPASPDVAYAAAMIAIAVSPDGNDAIGFAWLNSQLEAKNLYRLHPSSLGGVVRVMLQMPGWEKYQSLGKQRIESRTAFMALKFGQAAVTSMVDECVRPAVERAGFRLRILSDPQGVGLIDDKIRVGLLAAWFVISDLTGGSHGAYWEAGFGEGRGIPVIYTCGKVEWEKNKTHFDTNHMATIIWDSSDLKKAQDDLVAMRSARKPARSHQMTIYPAPASSRFTEPTLKRNVNICCIPAINRVSHRRARRA